ncbi:hypothetical protein OK016_22760 [Vibrio chagasii]|nr:hypothetical protein [Vibrio chagasii]
MQRTCYVTAFEIVQVWLALNTWHIFQKVIREELTTVLMNVTPAYNDTDRLLTVSNLRATLHYSAPIRY